MTLAELDEVLRVWKARLASIAENLLDLQSESAYRSLTGTGGLEKIAVTGLTAARVKPALGAVHTMFEQFGLLQATVDQAESLRKELPAFFGGDAKAREIQHLLFGKSIQLSTVNIPLEQRTLQGGIRGAERIAPEELLGSMEQTFASARDAVMSADRAWTEFAENSSRIEGEIARLRGQKALPSALLASSLDAVEAKLAAVRAEAKTDPLGAEGELRSQAEPALADVARRIDLAEQTGGQLRTARARWEELLRLHGEAGAAIAEARDKVGEGIALPVREKDETIRAIGEWLVRLEGKRDEGAIEAVTVGLRHWNAAAEACVSQERTALEAARARVEQRSELRGRLHALKAKARRFGVAESQEFAELGGRAETLLYSRPTDLEGAAAAVAHYEKRLRGNGNEA